MLAAQIEPIVLLTGLATAGALVLFLAPVTMMKMLFGQPQQGLQKDDRPRFLPEVG
jgi:hypothetical protein